MSTRVPGAGRPTGAAPVGFEFRAGSAPRRLSLTPLVDVVFILLLFFMLTSRFEQWQGLTVNTAAPSQQASDSQAITDDKAAVLRFSADGTLSLDGQRVGRRDLSRLLEQRVEADPTMTLFIVPGSGLNVQELMQVVDLVRAAGVATLSVGKP